MSTRTAHRICPLCEATCGLEITLVDEVVTLIRGDRDNPFSGGFVCPKGTTLGRLHDDPDRLRRPVVRRGGDHVEVGWDEAFAVIADRLGAILEADRNSVAVYLGNPNAHSFQNTLALRPLIKALGTRNVFTASTVDQMPKQVSAACMFGGALTIPIPDIDRTDHLLLLGANPWESNGSLATAPDWPGRLEAIRARGGKVVVVDPRRTKTAAAADEHVAIRPGTDAALLVAMISVLFEDEHVSLDGLADRVAGVDAVAEAVERFAPDRVAGWTGVEAPAIRRLAHDLARAESGCVYGRIGTHTVAFGTLSAWAVDVLNTLTGNLDRAGGVMFPAAPHLSFPRPPRAFQTGRWRSRVRGLPEVLGELPVATMADEMLSPGEGQVRALVTVAGNPVLTTPDGGRLDAALAQLDFMVSVDPYVNETTRHADVVLPPPSALQKSHYDLAFTSLSVRDYAAYTPAVLPLHPNEVSEYDILVTLTGIALGLGSSVDPAVLSASALAAQVAKQVEDPMSSVHGRDPGEILDMLGAWSGAEAFLDLMIRTGHRGDAFGSNPDGLTLEKLAACPHGIDFGPLQPRLTDVLATPSGKVELAPEPIIADLDRLAESIDVPPPAEMLLVGRRHLRSNNSWLHNVEVLVKGKERCTLQIHPDDAARIGVAVGDEVRVTSKAGVVVAPVEVTDTVMAGVVSLPYGWGHDREGTRLSVASRRPGVNVNLLTDATQIDPLSGNAVLNAVPVELQPA